MCECSVYGMQVVLNQVDKVYNTGRETENIYHLANYVYNIHKIMLPKLTQ